MAARCPYCGRRLVKTERYCWFCEHDVSNVVDEEEKPRMKEGKK